MQAAAATLDTARTEPTMAALDERKKALDAFEKALDQRHWIREAALEKREAALETREARPFQMAMIDREAALKEREAKLKEREAKLEELEDDLKLRVAAWESGPVLPVKRREKPAAQALAKEGLVSMSETRLDTTTKLLADSDVDDDFEDVHCRLAPATATARAAPKAPRKCGYCHVVYLSDGHDVRTCPLKRMHDAAKQAADQAPAPAAS